MSQANLIINQPGFEAREMTVAAGAAVSMGRALDNTISLDGDPNISRYHAVINGRPDGFWLSDLGSSNGTTVNNQPVSYEYKLKEGDTIVLGGSSTIVFHESAPETAAPAPTAAQPTPQSAVQYDMAAAAATAATPTVNVSAPTAPIPSASPSTSPPILLIAGIGIGAIALIAIVGLYFGGAFGGSCKPSVKIVSPQSGSVVRGSVKIRVETENAKCIERVIYQLDGNEIAKAEASPYGVTLNPSDFATVAPGNHLLTAVVQDQNGKNKLQPDEVLLDVEVNNVRQPVIDNPQTTTPPVDTTNTSAPPPPLLPPTNTGAVDVPGLARNLATQISRKSGYVIDQEFAEAIRTHTNEYRISGVTDRARRSRRDINKAFRDKGLEPLIGYVMALSRSKFNEGATSGGLGLWQVPPAIAQGYLSPNESPNTALVDSKRSSEIAAAYMKDLINTFEMDDFMYAIACYGMPISQAGEVRTKLISTASDPNARRDFWKMVKSGVIGPDQADRVVRFFAAGVVGENPQSFALPNEQPFSSLY